MANGMQQATELVTPGQGGYGGVNTALQFSQIPREQSPKMVNGYMPKIGAIGKRPGSLPVTTSALAAAIKHLTVYHTPTSDDILAASGTTLYKFNGTDTLTPQTMTNALNTSDIHTVAYTDGNSNSVLMITDAGAIKQYAAGVVKNVVPAPNDASPNPPNDYANVNTKGIKFCWVYSSHVFFSDGKDTVWYTKRFTSDYIPSVQYERWVRDNDYVNGCGIAFNNYMLLPMRRGWGYLTGQTFDNFDGNQFLNTFNGVIAPRSIQKITYADGKQSIVYLSDDGVYEIYDTTSLDSGARQYSSRALMKDKVDFLALGLTDAEKSAAVAYYDSTFNLYMLCFKQGTQDLAYCYDTRNGEWYPWDNIKACSLIRNGQYVYFAGSEGHLRRFGTDLYSDWNESTKTTGTPVHFQRYSPLLSFEFSGFASFWDEYLVEAKQWLVPSSLDIKVVFGTISATISVDAPWKNSGFIWGVSKWGEAQWFNLDYTDVVNEPDPIYFFEMAKYAQVLWDSPRDEPCEIYKDRFTGRLSGI